MTIGLLFWILMILAFFFGPWPFWGANAYRPYASTLLLLVLIGLLGWQVFGPALHR